MHLKLPATYIDPTTLAPLPGAVAVITDAQFQLRAGSTILQLAVYATATAAASGREPISQTPIVLTPGEIAAQQPALLAACFAVLQQRAEFTGTTLVP